MKVKTYFLLDERFKHKTLEDTPENREYDYAASEILKNAKFACGPTGFGDYYYGTAHWNDIKVYGNSLYYLKEIVDKQYPKNIAEKIINLVEWFLEKVFSEEVTTYTELEMFKNYFFAPRVAA